jgi:hypothetical protein
MRADAVHAEHCQREQQTLPQIRNAEDIRESLEKCSH